MRATRIHQLTVVAGLLGLCCATWAQPSQIAVDGAHYAMSQLPAMRFRAEGYDYDHEVLVALPATYGALPDRRYPVLWVMDGALLFDLTVGMVSLYVAGNRIPELIVVGVGHPREEGLAGLGKRTIDLFAPDTPLWAPGPARDYMRKQMAELGVNEEVNPFADAKGDKFLAFLIDQLRPTLAEKYRMANDHTLVGHSAGGAFTGYAMFEHPGGFDRYIVGSGTNSLTLGMEAAYAAEHDDLQARVFIGAGDLEANNLSMSAQRIVSRTVLFAENLLLRQYPSLTLETRLYRDRDHFDVLPLIVGDGLKSVFANETAKLQPMPY